MEMKPILGHGLVLDSLHSYIYTWKKAIILFPIVYFVLFHKATSKWNLILRVPKWRLLLSQIFGGSYIPCFKPIFSMLPH